MLRLMTILKGCRPFATAPFSFYNAATVLVFVTTLWCCGTIADAAPEVKSLWIVRDTFANPERVAELVDFAAEHRFNVLFVQVRGRGDAYYRSYFVPEPEGRTDIPGEFDPLSALIVAAHARGIEVHAWLNMYLAWSADNPPSDPSHPLNSHPEWYMHSADGLNMARCPISAVRNGDSEGRYLSPGLAPVRNYLSRVITEILVTYNVDGIHLDYVRYPGRGYDFHPAVREAFTERYGVDPVAVVNGDGSVDPTLRLLGEWVDFRVGQIDNQIESIRRRIDLIDPNIRLSAAVKPHADEAYYQYGQNWIGWLNRGLVDFVVPMSYVADVPTLAQLMENGALKTDRRKIVCGIGLYRLSPVAADEQIRYVREAGFLGHCFFSYTTFSEMPGLAGKLATLKNTTDEGLPVEFGHYLRSLYE